FHKEMHMQGMFTIDTNGWGASHSGLLSEPDLEGIDAESARAFCSSLRSGFLASGKSKHRQPPFATIKDAVRPYFLAPLQLPTDDTIMHYSPVSVEEYVHALSDWAESANRNVVFKLHPGSEAPAVADAVRSRVTNRVFLMDENIHALIDAANAVL